jgi:glycosyltransferase involved in cell wall biosynthesis
VSVVIPCYNMSGFVRAAVDSALAQTVPVHEVIVVDDGSTDDLATALGAIDDSRLRTVRRERNGGTSVARNLGSSLATGDLVAFLDADDTWYPSKIERQLDHLANEPAAVGIGAQMHHVGRRGEPVGITGVEVLDEAVQQEVRSAELMPFPFSTIVADREVMIDVGGFDETLRLVQDLDFLARLATRGSILTVAEPLGAYRVHAASASARYFHDQRETLRFVRARIAARTAGRDLTWDEYIAGRPRESRREWFDDTSRSLYRAAGALAADGRYFGASWRLGASVVMQPSYVITRMRQQHVFGYLRRKPATSPLGVAPESSAYTSDRGAHRHPRGSRRRLGNGVVTPAGDGGHGRSHDHDRVPTEQDPGHRT